MQEAEPPRAATHDAFLDLGGDMARRMREHDWGGSPIGPHAGWPTPLRTLARLMLSANQPMFIAWG